MSTQAGNLHRRTFLKTAVSAGAAIIAAPHIIPSSALGKDGAVAPSERIVLGGIGIGNRGTYDLGCFLEQGDVQFVGVCDVKANRRNAVKQIADQKYGNQDCKMYRDFRELLDRKDIDAVLIATGPNWHCTMASYAARAGKDMYCEKPCTKNIAQSLALAENMRRAGVVFQAGTQRRNLPHFAFACELARTGKLGKLKTVYAHPMGMQALMSGWLPAENEPNKEEVDWNLYLGTAAWRPFNAKLLDGFNFEKGGGLVGGGVLEWGSHCVDLCQWAVGADGTAPVEYNPPENGEMVARYANGVKLVLRENNWIPLGSCPVRFEGETGWVETADSGKYVLSSPELLAGRTVAEIDGYPATFHVRDFLDCVKTRSQPKANADAACFSHITCHAANIALALNRKLTYDLKKHEFVGDAEANRLRSEGFASRGDSNARSAIRTFIQAQAIRNADSIIMSTTFQVKRRLAYIAVAIFLVNIASAFAAGELPAIPSESALIETLKTKPAEKAIACKQLAIVGTKKSVPQLAKLLSDKELSSWSRIALEAIPDPAADKALIREAKKLDSELLVGTINSIGVRKSAGATDVLADLLKNEDTKVASAAAVSLGKIGNDTATKTLRSSLSSSSVPVRSAVAEGCILCAERLMKDGKTAEAAAIYDEVRKADMPKQRALEATRGSIIARHAAGIPLLVEQLHSSDKAFFQIGLMSARQLPGRQVTDALSAELPRLAPQQAVGLLSVLADRNDGGLPPAVLNAAKNGDKQLRIAAIGVVGRLGDSSSVPALLEIAADSDDDLAKAAASALATVPGENVNSELVSSISKADGKALAALIQAVGVKRIEATPELMKALSNSDATIRHSALAALGETIKPKDLHVLIAQYVNGKNADDTAVAGKALRTACVRMADREACAAELAAAMPHASTASNTHFVEILAAMGGPKALETIGAAAKGDDAKLQDTATKALGKWMTVDAEPVLLDLAGEKSCKYQDRALRGYIRLARQFSMPDAKRAQICDSALGAAKRDEDRKLVLEALERHPSEDGLKIVVKAAKYPGLQDDVRQASLVIAQKVKGDRTAVRQALAEIGVKPVKIEIVKAEYGAGNSKRDVTEMLKKDVGDFSVINLHSPSFNKSFGGDPAPGATKQLVVEYRLDGKSGKATFAENDVIMLPTPK